MIGFSSNKNFPVDEERRQCAHCGSCTAVCPVYRVTGREPLTARGKLHLLESGLAGHPSAAFKDIFAGCLLCGACENTCARDLPVRERIIEARAAFPSLYGRHALRKTVLRKALARPFLLKGLLKAGLTLQAMSLLPGDSGLRLKLGVLGRGDAAGQAGEAGKLPEADAGQPFISYFTGCLAGYLQPAIRDAAGSLVAEAVGRIPHVPDAQVCCGLAAWSAGDPGEARRLARRNIEVFAGHPGPIVTSCSSCTVHLKKYPALFAGDAEWRQKAEEFSGRVREFTAFLMDHRTALRFSAAEGGRVFYHEPCHLRFGGPDRELPRRILRQVENITLVESDRQHCCGQGGLFQLGYPELADRIFNQTFAAAGEANPDIIVTGCSGCLLQWQAGAAERHSRLKVMHSALFLAGCREEKT